MCSFINCTCHHVLLESRKGTNECEWVGYVEWMLHEMCRGLSEIHNHNGRLTPLLVAYTCMYTKLQTQWHIHCCHRWLNSLFECILNSRWSNTINIIIVVILGFLLFQFNTIYLGGYVYHLQQSFLFGCLNLIYVVQDSVGETWKTVCSQTQLCHMRCV
jgi:hypothetical protein